MHSTLRVHSLVNLSPLSLILRIQNLKKTHMKGKDVGQCQTTWNGRWTTKHPSIYLWGCPTHSQASCHLHESQQTWQLFPTRRVCSGVARLSCQSKARRSSAAERSVTRSCIRSVRPVQLGRLSSDPFESGIRSALLIPALPWSRGHASEKAELPKKVMGGGICSRMTKITGPIINMDVSDKTPTHDVDSMAIALL